MREAVRPAAAGGRLGPSSEILTSFDESRLSGAHWRWTAIAALGDYLDAGSIVAGGVALPLWTSYLHFGSTTVSLIAAFSSNGISTGVGALIAGRLGDKFGRKFIYTWDLLLYCLGAIIVAAGASGAMVIAGYMLLGLAVGIDVPTSWSLIAEYAPRRHRGKLMAFTNVFWYIGPIVILMLSLAFHPLGLLGARLVFLSLLVVGAGSYLLRRFLTESPRWSLEEGRSSDVSAALAALSRHRGSAAGPPPSTGPVPAIASAAPGPSSAGPNSVRAVSSTTPSAMTTRPTRGYRALLDPKLLKRFAFITPLYVLWGIPAGTYGFFEPTLFKTVGAHSLAASDGLDILWFGSAIVALFVVFMPLNDRIDRRILYAISAAFCAAGFFLLVFLPVSNIWVAIGNILLFGFGQGIGLWPLQRTWSVELFPTSVRNTAQGVLWSFMRITLGIWSFFLADVTGALGFPVVALMLALMFCYNFVVGGIFGPRSQSVALEDI